MHVSIVLLGLKSRGGFDQAGAEDLAQGHADAFEDPSQRGEESQMIPLLSRSAVSACNRLCAASSRSRSTAEYSALIGFSSSTICSRAAAMRELASSTVIGLSFVRESGPAQ